MRRRAAFLLASVLLVGACGGSASPAPSSDASTGPSPSDVFASDQPTGSASPGASASVVPGDSAAPSASAKPKTYKVRSGDNLTFIAKKLKVTLKALLAANPKIDPNGILKPGTILKVPAK